MVSKNHSFKNVSLFNQFVTRQPSQHVTGDCTFDHQVELIRHDRLDKVVQVARVDARVLFSCPTHVQSVPLRYK